MDTVYFIKVSDPIRARYEATSAPGALTAILADINTRISALLLDMAGRDIRVNIPNVMLESVPNDYYNTRGEYDPFHDEGNGTNHRLSQCSERCK